MKKVNQSSLCAAEMAYMTTRTQVLAKIELLKKAIEKADAYQSQTPRSWGHVGSLEYASEKLEEILNHYSM